MILGDGGSGKTFLLRHEALILQQKGFTIVPLPDPSSMYAFYKQNKKTVFVSDDIFGSLYLHDISVQKWSLQIDQIQQTINNGSHIFISSSRLDVYKEVKPNPMKRLNITLVDLTSSSFLLTKNEKEDIFKRYVPIFKGDISPSAITHPYFPLLCKIARGKINNSEIVDLFKNPIKSIANDLGVMKTKSRVNFCCICICVLFQNEVPVSWLLDPNVIPIEKRYALDLLMYEFNLKLNRETDRDMIRQSFRVLKKSYTEFSSGIWSIFHMKIHEHAIKLCGNYLFNTFIEYGDPLFIANHYILNSIQRKFEDQDKRYNYIRITVSKQNEEKYFSRLSSDIRNQGMDIVYNNKQLKYKLFRQKLIMVILNDSGLRTYFRSICLDGNQYCLQYNPFIRAVISGYHDIVQMLIALGCDITYPVIQIRPDHLYWRLFENYSISTKNVTTSTTLLHVAAGYGHENIVQLCISKDKPQYKPNAMRKKVLVWNNRFEIATFSHGCLSILYEFVAPYLNPTINCNTTTLIKTFTCPSKHGTSQLPLVVYNEININSLDTDGKTALMLAILKKMDVAVFLLISNGADINIRAKNGKTSLMLAITLGLENITSVLVKSGADTEIRDNVGFTSLALSCVLGKNSTALILIENGASINSLDNYGDSILMKMVYLISEPIITTEIIGNGTDVDVNRHIDKIQTYQLR